MGESDAFGIACAARSILNQGDGFFVASPSRRDFSHPGAQACGAFNGDETFHERP